MGYNHPHYHRSPPSLLESYSTRLLLGLLLSLATVLLLLHVPDPNSGNRVGWSTRAHERIPLSAVQHEEESTAREAENEEKSGAPPPTQHAPPVSAATGNEKTATNDREKEEKSSSESEKDDSRQIRSIATLSAQDNQPKIVGGRGSLYLEIQYPPAARKEGIEGLLMLQFTVDEEGNARRIDVTKSLHPLCDSAAVRALRSVKFRPGTHNGEPIPVRMSLPVRFQLQPTPEGKEKALRTKRTSSSGS